MRSGADENARIQSARSTAVPSTVSVAGMSDADAVVHRVGAEPGDVPSASIRSSNVSSADGKAGGNASVSQSLSGSSAAGTVTEASSMPAALRSVMPSDPWLRRWYVAVSTSTRRRPSYRGRNRNVTTRPGSSSPTVAYPPLRGMTSTGDVTTKRVPRRPSRRRSSDVDVRPTKSQTVGGASIAAVGC